MKDEKKDLIICRIKDSPFSYDDLMQLIYASVQERLDQGLNFIVASMSADDYREKTKDSIVIVAYRDNDLLGTACSTIKKDKHGKNFSYEEMIYVSPECKRGGLGSKMQLKRIEVAKENGCPYTISDTAEGATSSVRWHLKNGYKLVGLRSYEKTNYYSKIFRWQIEPHPLWNNSLFCKVHYWFSSIKCRMCYHEDGSYKGPLKLYVKLRNS